MGAGLAKAAVRAARGLDHAPARLYIGMALSALDDDPHPVFYRGEEAMTVILGADPDEAGYRAVRRALRSLRGSRHVESQGSAPGRTARHFLLDGAGAPLTPSQDGERPVNNSDAGRSASCEEPGMADGERTNGGRSASEWRTVSVRMADGERPPEEERNERGGGGMPTARTCTRHPHWNHEQPCRACAADREAFENLTATSGRTDTLPRRPQTCSVHAEYPLPCDRCAADALEAAS